MTIATQFNPAINQGPKGYVDGIAAYGDSSAEDYVHWGLAIDGILGWFRDDDEIPEDERPDVDVWRSALDYACSARENNVEPPSNVVLSGSGRIAMEWRTPTEALVIEFTGRDAYSYALFEGTRVVERGNQEASELSESQG